jgi:hypothetical protein
VCLCVCGVCVSVCECLCVCVWCVCVSVCECLCVSLDINLSSASHSVTVLQIFSNLAFRFYTVNSVRYDEPKNSRNTHKCQIITPKHVAALYKTEGTNYRTVHLLVLTRVFGFEIAVFITISRNILYFLHRLINKTTEGNLTFCVSETFYAGLVQKVDRNVVSNVGCGVGDRRMNEYGALGKAEVLEENLYQCHLVHHKSNKN